MLSLLVFLLVLGVLIVIHEFGHFIAAKKIGVKVEQFSLGFGKKLLAKKSGDTEYSISAIPLGGFVKLAGDNMQEYKGAKDEYFSKTPGQRALIIFFGPFFNYILGFLCFWLVFFFGYPTLTSRVGGLVDGFGAQAAGIHAGDRIVAIDGQKVIYWEELQKLIQDNKDKGSILLEIERDNKKQAVKVDIQDKEFTDLLGKKKNLGLIGITPYYDEVVKIRHGILKSFMLSAEKTWDLTVLTYNGLWRMLTGQMSVRDSVTGPLGIFVVTAKVANQGIVAILNFMGLLSISLAIFNLLPLPILDGGHILFLFIEKIRGKALGAKAENIVARVGLSLIIGLAVFVTYNDIARFFGERIVKWFVK